MIEVRLALILNIGQNMFFIKKRYYKVHFNSNINNNKKTNTRTFLSKTVKCIFLNF